MNSFLIIVWVYQWYFTTAFSIMRWHYSEKKFSRFYHITMFILIAFPLTSPIFSIRFIRRHLKGKNLSFYGWFKEKV